MKLTQDTMDVDVTIKWGEASMSFRPYSSVPRVIEYPKVVRIAGKQYKITECEFFPTARYDHVVKIRVPLGARFINTMMHWTPCDVESYE